MQIRLVKSSWFSSPSQETLLRVLTDFDRILVDGLKAPSVSIPR
jgi:hypothetical protein